MDRMGYHQAAVSDKFAVLPDNPFEIDLQLGFHS